MTGFVDPRGALAQEQVEYDLVIAQPNPRVGLLSNSFAGCDHFLERLATQLVADRPGLTIRHYKKPSPSQRVDSALAARMVDEVDCVVAAYGH